MAIEGWGQAPNPSTPHALPSTIYIYIYIYIYICHVAPPTLSLRPAAADAIAPMLRTHPSLTSLDLYGNALGPTGAKAIVHALRDNTRLISLDLTLNDLDEPTQDYVPAALELYPTHGSHGGAQVKSRAA